MILEFAIEPEFFTSWERCRYLTEKFGVSKGKLISRYPKRWLKMVYANLEQDKDLGEMDRKRIEEKLSGIKEQMLYRHHDWNQSIDWMMNAERETDLRPFDGIIGADNPRSHPHVFVFDDLDENCRSEWGMKTEYTVERTARDLASIAAPLLRISQHVVFIDPHIDPYKKGYVESLPKFLEACIIGRHNKYPLKIIEFISRYKVMSFEEEFRRQLGRELQELNSMGVVVTVKRFKIRQKEESPRGADGLHNRYILTERGGLNYRWGLDAGGKGETDDVSLLNPATWDKRWKEYIGDNPVFDLGEKFEVRGTA
ncbi:hypothetical protein [Thiocapsa rosea]|uniref:Uncharacterized protein n=1 Tax=Thiocapsa rosea TaxID=69360 RepID=A0A495VB79_9GAMM|nr:hypothetical protein [Thiocapsa rosea]RKT46651.1 hypothetical protein BDD21_4180 [Thiocapsa rosea]